MIFILVLSDTCITRFAFNQKKRALDFAIQKAAHYNVRGIVDERGLLLWGEYNAQHVFKLVGLELKGD